MQKENTVWYKSVILE